MVDPAEVKLPWSLYLVGWFVVAGGCHSLATVVAGLYWDSLTLDLGVVAIFAGRGLLQLHEGWRRLTRLFLGLVLCAVPFMILVFVGGFLHWLFTPNDYLGGTPFNTCGLHPATAMLLIGASFVLSLWAYRVLSSERANLLFEANSRRLEAIRKGTIPPANQRAPWQFDVSTLLMLMIVVSLVFGSLVMEGLVLTSPTGE